jgi:hypothetical protein
MHLSEHYRQHLTGECKKVKVLTDILHQALFTLLHPGANCCHKKGKCYMQQLAICVMNSSKKNFFHIKPDRFISQPLASRWLCQPRLMISRTSLPVPVRHTTDWATSVITGVQQIQRIQFYYLFLITAAWDVLRYTLVHTYLCSWGSWRHRQHTALTC